MCRWIAYISPTEPCLLSDVLITPAHALTKQVSTHYLPYLIHHQLAPIDLVERIPGSTTGPGSSNGPPISGTTPTGRLAPPIAAPEDPRLHALRLRNLALNADGHGLVWYTRTKSFFSSPQSSSAADSSLSPILYRSPRPLSTSDNFHSIAQNTSTLCLLAHVRAGSGAPVSELNCHPFVFGRISVMHNGSVGAFAKIKRALVERLRQDVYACIHGGTDSEVLAALIVHHLGLDQGFETGEFWNHKSDAKRGQLLATAVLAAFDDVLDAQRTVLGKTEPSSLNVCVTDGRVLVATRYRNGEEEPPSLYWSEMAGVTLNSRYPGHPDGENGNDSEGKKEAGEHGRHIIVASEPSTFKEEEWKLMEKNTILIAEETGDMRVKKITEEGNILVVGS
ncbi:Glutamine amidotransferase domain-containing protein [Elsinoe fawcettii]|nr:Glutamine amidotransferase domain-containing protein [Elsinoe fawcettii]